jgi:hypothetical protein
MSHEFTLSAEEHKRLYLNTKGGYLHAYSGRVPWFSWFSWFSWFLIRWDKWTETASKKTQLLPAVTYSMNKYLSKWIKPSNFTEQRTSWEADSLLASQ